MDVIESRKKLEDLTAGDHFGLSAGSNKVLEVALNSNLKGVREVASQEIERVARGNSGHVDPQQFIPLWGMIRVAIDEANRRPALPMEIVAFHNVVCAAAAYGVYRAARSLVEYIF